MCKWMCPQVDMYMQACEYRSPWKTEVSDLLRPELLKVVSYLPWVQGTEKGTTGRASRTLHC